MSTAIYHTIPEENQRIYLPEGAEVSVLCTMRVTSNPDVQYSHVDGDAQMWYYDEAQQLWYPVSYNFDPKASGTPEYGRLCYDTAEGTDFVESWLR